MIDEDNVIEQMMAAAELYYGQNVHHPTCVVLDTETQAPHVGLYSLEMVEGVTLPIRSFNEPQWNPDTAREVIHPQLKRYL